MRPGAVARRPAPGGCLDVGVKEYRHPLRIGELAARAGTTTRTLRYYESRGPLPARRGNNGYRSYDEDDLKLLRQIRTLQDFGFGLEGTRPFVECLRAGHPEGDACPASLAVYRRKLDELDALIRALGSVREQVGEQLARAERAMGGLAADAAVRNPCARCFPRGWPAGFRRGKTRRRRQKGGRGDQSGRCGRSDGR